MTHKSAPGPHQAWLDSAPEMGPLEFILRLSREFGDVVKYPSIYGPVYLVNHPDHVAHIFQHKNYVRVPLLRMTLGDGLITSEGSYWQGQRQLVQPAFHSQCLANFVTIITDATRKMLERWQSFADTGRSFALDREMTRLTLLIIGEALFSADLGSKASTLAAAITTMIEDAGHLGRTLFGSSHNIEPSRNEKFARALQIVDEAAYELIEARRRSRKEYADLLSLLLNSRNPQTGQSLNDQQVRDEVVTMLLAGHETTASMLSWACYMVSHHTEVENQLRTELVNILGTRPPAYQNLVHLRYNRMVIQETLRLYPPVWFIARRKVLADELIGGYEVPSHSLIVLSPYTMHRHPSYWPDPDIFLPERFAQEETASRPRYAYFPFGGGPHLCLGNNLAMMEGQMVLAMVLQKYRLQPASPNPVEPEPLVTLRSPHGLHMFAINCRRLVGSH